MADDLITKSTLKKDYGLTDSMIAKIGDPDATKPNPHYRQGAPMKLYERARVEQWIAQHQDMLQRSAPRKAAAQKAVETKRQNAQEMINEALSDLQLRPIPPDIDSRTQAYLFARYPDYDGYVTPKAIAAHIRHNYTNYENLLLKIKGKVGAGNLYAQIKEALNQRIEEHYGYKSE